MDVLEARELICGSGQRLLRDHLVAGTWGNISCKLDDTHMVITPSGIPYEELKPENMVLVNIETLEYEGNLKPSSESSIHAEIYKVYKEINAVVHNHSVNASVIAATGQKVRPYIADMAMILGPDVRSVEHAMPGSSALRDGVIKALEGRYAAILKNHGALCVGRDMEEAFTACHLLEKSCRIQIYVELLGGGEPLTDEEANIYRKRYLTIYQKK